METPMIKILRTNKGLTQRDVAKGTGITASLLGRFENRKENPDWDCLEKLSAFYQVPIRDLI